MQWGIDTRSERLTGEEADNDEFGLTPLGESLIVGALLIAMGTLIL